MRKKIKDTLHSVGIVFWGIGLAAKASPIYLIHTIIDGALEALRRLGESVFLLAYLLDCIEKGRPWHYAIRYIIGLIAFLMLKFTYGSIASSLIKKRGEEKIQRALSMKLFKKAKSMDISFYDNPSFYNDFVWAMKEAPKQIVASFWNVYFLSYVIVSALFTGVFVSLADPFAIIIVIGGVIINITTALAGNKKRMEMEELQKPHQRKRDYINRVFYLADFAKDIRMGNMKEHLFSDYEISNKKIEKIVRAKSTPLIWLSYIRHNFSDILNELYLLYLLYQSLILNSMGLGTVVAVFNAMDRLRNSLSSFTWLLPDIQKQSLYVQKMKTFLDAENHLPNHGTLPIPDNFELTLHNVSFTYPNTDVQVLKNINLTIPKGSKIALVGYNGAGKSTLVKLLMRLYDPTDGHITYGGTDIKEYPLEHYREQISTLFQDYQIIAATLGENITMSDAVLDKDKAIQIMKDIDFIDVFQSMPNGFDTQLTKEFHSDGVNLSGGEAQKVAICRVLYSNAHVLILDEPSSALDPLSEYNLNHTIQQLAKDRSIIFISHRLSTTRIADTIYMLENGTIIEQGSHEELMKQKGKYAQMFLLQAEKYR